MSSSCVTARSWSDTGAAADVVGFGAFGFGWAIASEAHKASDAARDPRRRDRLRERLIMAISPDWKWVLIPFCTYNE